MIFWPLRCRVRQSATTAPRPCGDALILERFPSRRRKRDVPETWRRRREFHRNEIAFLIFNGRPRNPAALLLRGSLINQFEFCLHGELFPPNHIPPLSLSRSHLSMHARLLPP